MKLFAKLMIALLFIAILLPFTILKDDNGNSMMSFSDFKLPDFNLSDFKFPDLSKFDDSKPIPASDDDLEGKDLFYKWYDSAGNVQFTSEPPAQGIEYTVKGYNPDANVIQAVKLPPKAVKSNEPEGSQLKKSAPGKIDDPYSQNNIKKLFEDSKNIQKLLNQRFKDQESIINQ